MSMRGMTPMTRPLALNTVFTLTVAAAVADEAGNALGEAQVSTFRTASPDATPPRVQTTSPLDGAVGVGLTEPIDVTFTEPHVGDRTLDFNTEGLVHVGLLPELIEDARRTGSTDADLEPLFRSAEGYLRMWELAEERAAVLAP